ncbi:MAG: cbb3-type cytochrome c oxidase subunit I [Planctomycetaceae bacterium]|nr:cbb3-type cytochrome c oxidase subunit I [Planctomycetaceae bacterium]
MPNVRAKATISKLWFQVSVLTFIAGFSVLGYLAYLVTAEHPPIPKTVQTPDGTILFTADNVMAGQNLFQQYGLMQLGTIFGHGAYLGPDFTAQYLHRASIDMFEYYQSQNQPEAQARATVLSDLKSNRFDKTADTLVYTPAQAHAFKTLLAYYTDFFGSHERQPALKKIHISNPAQIRDLTAYFSWAAWTTAAQRPGKSYSYTNNWPPEPLAGNTATTEAFLWSVLSLIALLGGAGILFFVIGRYDILGWHRKDEDEPGSELEFRAPETVQLTHSQRATAWYFLVVAGLFLLQGLLGGANAHYHVEPGGFYGLNLSKLLPYNLSRMWHLQLALFFVASSYLAMGIFITPMIAGREPRYQKHLAIVLFAALVAVVAGSLLGEAISLKGFIPAKGPWFWLGAQGWEYLDLGRLWQILLTIGMFLWVVILVRGMAGTLRTEHPANMPYLFLYSALSIPVFYAAGMAFGKETHFAVMDFWRFWVVHLWVEDFLELFTTIMVAYIFVLLGVVRITTAARVVYLDIILYSVGGVIGTMHHLYFSGAPAIHMSLGAFFSAMEVIPLLLLTFEAWQFMRLGGTAQGTSLLGASSDRFPHKWAVMFLIAVGFWNFLGAGVFGFLINLPIVSYYEIGTQFTANHAHGALMGVYGMLAIGFFMFAARYFIPPDRKTELAMKTSFLGLNIGLAMMIGINLIPIGFLQLRDSFQNGYWHAREPQFFTAPAVRAFEWARLPGDVLFIVAGILPVVYLAVRMFINRNRYGKTSPAHKAEPFTG